MGKSMMRFSFKALLVAVTIAALLTGGVVLPETSRVRVIKRVENFEGATIELTDSRLSEKDPRRWFFGEDSGRFVQKLTFPVVYKNKPVTGENAEAGSMAIEKIICDWRGLTHLESLTMRTKFPISGKTMRGLAQLKALRFVWVRNAEIDDDAVRALSKLKNLEVLYLTDCRFTTEDFSSFERLKHLATINVGRDPNLESQISDQALASLRAAAKTAWVRLTFSSDYVRQRLEEFRERRKQERLGEEKGK